MIYTGTLNMDWSQPVSNKLRNIGQSSFDFDWSQPVSSKLGGNGQSSSDFDWSQPLSNKITSNNETSSSIDWSQPIASYSKDISNDMDSGVQDKLTGNQTSSGFDWGQPVSTVLGGTGLLDTSNKTEYNGPTSAEDSLLDDPSKNIPNGPKELHLNETQNEDSGVLNNSESLSIDTISQRLKFRACLKLVVEELCTLPHHCEIHNKDLRSTFTDWLKKELNLIHRICDFKKNGTKNESLLPSKVSTPTAIETGRLNYCLL